MSFPFGAHSLLFLSTTLCFSCTVWLWDLLWLHTHTIMVLSHFQLMIKYPAASRYISSPAPILSLAQNIAVTLAKRKAEYEEEQRLLEEAEGLLPLQAPPEPSSGLIGRKLSATMSIGL